MTMYYDRAGKPLSLEEWAALFESGGREEMKRVDATNVGGYWVSTVWLGLDHSFGGGPPLIFETMVFNDEGEGDEVYMTRYATEEGARYGHRWVVSEIKRTGKPVPEQAEEK